MPLKKELLELALTLILPLLALLPLVSPARSIQRWVGYVLLTAATAVLSIGFLMSRLLAQCLTNTPTCSNSQVVTLYLAGLTSRYSDCSVCMDITPSTLQRLALLLNGSHIQVAVVATALCLLMSLLTLLRFALWTRRNALLRNEQR